ncbi:hypothetical protein SELMODRAFT_421961 [Selaginella moellendorffii]|uniref:Uncharacterized protein n=1 Tax=Selaginella moellendorffii TaxID=88036 RepID=D8SGX3_SELML|nr:hypothetical protein SELMODRAFT_421961 [Selaginella moellendorffii]
MVSMVTNEAFRLRFVSESNVGVLYDAPEVVAKAAEEGINQETFVQSLYMGNANGSKLLERCQGEDIGEENFYSWETEAQTIMQEAICHLPQKAGLRLLLVFDEARELLGSGIDNNISLPLRRATAALQPDDGVLAVFSDTHFLLPNFAIPDSLQPSDRLALEAFSLASPIWGCFCADKLTDWMRVINMARNKLLGGGSAWNTYMVEKGHLTTAAALAVLGARCAIDFDPTYSLTSKLVAAHLMTVVKVEPNRKQIWVGTAMEPVFAQAAAQVMRKLDEDKRNVELYSHLHEFIEHLVGKSLTEFAKYRSGKHRRQQAMQVQELRSLDTDQLKRLRVASEAPYHQSGRWWLSQGVAAVRWGPNLRRAPFLEPLHERGRYYGGRGGSCGSVRRRSCTEEEHEDESCVIAAKDKEQVEEEFSETEESAEPDEVQLEARMRRLHHLDSLEQRQEEERLYKAWLAWLNMERDNQVILKVTGLGAFAGVLGEDLLRLFHAIHKIDKVPMLDKHNKLEKIQGPSLKSMFPVANIRKD